MQLNHPDDHVPFTVSLFYYYQLEYAGIQFIVLETKWLFFDTETLDLKEFFQNGRHFKNSRLWVSTPQILLAQGHFLLVLVYVLLEDDLPGPLYLVSKKIYCHELLNGIVF